MFYDELKYLIENYLGILVIIYILMPIVSGAIHFGKFHYTINIRILKGVKNLTYSIVIIFTLISFAMVDEIFDTLDDYFLKNHGTISSWNEIVESFVGAVDDLNEKYSKNDTLVKRFSKDETLERLKQDGDMYIHTHTTKSSILLKIFELLFALIILINPYIIWKINNKLY
jgi:hypothetical protein